MSERPSISKQIIGSKGNSRGSSPKAGLLTKRSPSSSPTKNKSDVSPKRHFNPVTKSPQTIQKCVSPKGASPCKRKTRTTSPTNQKQGFNNHGDVVVEGCKKNMVTTQLGDGAKGVEKCGGKESIKREKSPMLKEVASMNRQQDWDDEFLLPQYNFKDNCIMYGSWSPKFEAEMFGRDEKTVEPPTSIRQIFNDIFMPVMNMRNLSPSPISNKLKESTSVPTVVDDKEHIQDSNMNNEEFGFPCEGISEGDKKGDTQNNDISSDSTVTVTYSPNPQNDRQTNKSNETMQRLFLHSMAFTNESFEDISLRDEHECLTNINPEVVSSDTTSCTNKTQSPVNKSSLLERARKMTRDVIHKVRSRSPTPNDLRGALDDVISAGKNLIQKSKDSMKYTQCMTIDRDMDFQECFSSVDADIKSLQRISKTSTKDEFGKCKNYQTEMIEMKRFDDQQSVLMNELCEDLELPVIVDDKGTESFENDDDDDNDVIFCCDNQIIENTKEPWEKITQYPIEDEIENETFSTFFNTTAEECDGYAYTPNIEHIMCHENMKYVILTEDDAQQEEEKEGICIMTQDFTETIPSDMDTHDQSASHNKVDKMLIPDALLNSEDVECVLKYQDDHRDAFEHFPYLREGALFTSSMSDVPMDQVSESEDNPRKTVSLVTSNEADTQDRDITEVMALISDEVSLKRYPSVPDLTDLEKEVDQSLSTSFNSKGLDNRVRNVYTTSKLGSAEDGGCNKGSLVLTDEMNKPKDPIKELDKFSDCKHVGTSGVNSERDSCSARVDVEINRHLLNVIEPGYDTDDDQGSSDLSSCDELPEQQGQEGSKAFKIDLNTPPNSPRAGFPLETSCVNTIISLFETNYILRKSTESEDEIPQRSDIISTKTQKDSHENDQEQAAMQDAPIINEKDAIKSSEDCTIESMYGRAMNLLQGTISVDGSISPNQLVASNDSIKLHSDIFDKCIDEIANGGNTIDNTADYLAACLPSPPNSSLTATVLSESEDCKEGPSGTDHTYMGSNSTDGPKSKLDDLRSAFLESSPVTSFKGSEESAYGEKEENPEHTTSTGPEIEITEDIQKQNNDDDGDIGPRRNHFIKESISQKTSDVVDLGVNHIKEPQTTDIYQEDDGNEASVDVTTQREITMEYDFKLAEDQKSRVEEYPQDIEIFDESKVADASDKSDGEDCRDGDNKKSIKLKPVLEPFTDQASSSCSKYDETSPNLVNLSPILVRRKDAASSLTSSKRLFRHGKVTWAMDHETDWPPSCIPVNDRTDEEEDDSYNSTSNVCNSCQPGGAGQKKDDYMPANKNVDKSISNKTEQEIGCSSDEQAAQRGTVDYTESDTIPHHNSDTNNVSDIFNLMSINNDLGELEEGDTDKDVLICFPERKFSDDGNSGVDDSTSDLIKSELLKLLLPRAHTDHRSSSLGALHFREQQEYRKMISQSSIADAAAKNDTTDSIDSEDAKVPMKQTPALRAHFRNNLPPLIMRPVCTPTPIPSPTLNYPLSQVILPSVNYSNKTHKQKPENYRRMCIPATVTKSSPRHPRTKMTSASRVEVTNLQLSKSIEQTCSSACDLIDRVSDKIDSSLEAVTKASLYVDRTQKQVDLCNELMSRSSHTLDKSAELTVRVRNQVEMVQRFLSSAKKQHAT